MSSGFGVAMLIADVIPKLREAELIIWAWAFCPGGVDQKALIFVGNNHTAATEINQADSPNSSIVVIVNLSVLDAQLDELRFSNQSVNNTKKASPTHQMMNNESTK